MTTTATDVAEYMRRARESAAELREIVANFETVTGITFMRDDRSLCWRPLVGKRHLRHRRACDCHHGAYTLGNPAESYDGDWDDHMRPARLPGGRRALVTAPYDFEHPKVGQRQRSHLARWTRRHGLDWARLDVASWHRGTVTLLIAAPDALANYLASTEADPS